MTPLRWTQRYARRTPYSPTSSTAPARPRSPTPALISPMINGTWPAGSSTESWTCHDPGVIAANAKIEGCCSEPDPDTLVLLHRDLLPNADPSALPVFGDERWDLTHGIFEAHTQACSVIFTDCPDAFRTAVRRYVWELINHEAPQSIRSAGTDPLALSSVRSAFRILLPFLTWLDTRGHQLRSGDERRSRPLSR